MRGGARLAAALLVGAAACGGGRKVEVASPDLLKLDADQVMVGVEQTVTRDGVRRAHLQADTTYLLHNGSVAHLRHYRVDFFDGTGDRRSTLTAVDGVYDMKSGDMTARDDVVVVDSSRNQRLLTPRLRYDASTDRLRGDTTFVAYLGRDTVRGRGFVTDPGLDTVRVVRPAAVSPPDTVSAPDTASGRSLRQLP